MTHRSTPARLLLAACVMAGALTAPPLFAQVTPAAGYTPPDDTPSVKVGVTIFTDFTYQHSPTVKDADGNTINPSAFNIARSYINITGNVSHLVAYRVTPDITTETGTGSSLNGSYTFRLKYAFLQVNLDDWMPKGSWARLGLQQTPYIDYAEGVYRYRFQGTIFVDREGFLTSSDKAVSLHVNLPNNYGDVHVGFYNGDGYNKLDANDQKAIQARFTVRPFARGGMLARGLRLTAFLDADHYVRDGKKTRLVANAAFEHKYVNASVELLNAKDQTSAFRTDIPGRGFSMWVTPRSTKGVEGLLRYDQLTPNTGLDRVKRKRTIAGIAYWFPHTGGPAAAVLFDYDATSFDNVSPSQPKQAKVAVHGLVNF